MKKASQEIVLQKTRLSFDGNYLVHLNENRDVVTRLPAKCIADITISSRPSWFGVVIVTAGILINVVAYTVPFYTFVQVVTHIFGILVAAFGMIGIIRQFIVIETDGVAVVFYCFDPPGECRGFVESLRASKKITSAID